MPKFRWCCCQKSTKQTNKMSDPKPKQDVDKQGGEQQPEEKNAKDRKQGSADEDKAKGKAKEVEPYDFERGIRRLQAKYQELTAVFEEEVDMLRRDRNALAEEKATWEVLATKLDASVVPQSRVKLDIGGTVFATSKQTLTKFAKSFFAGMFSGRHELQPEDDGSFFVDRDPFVFRHVLNFMRGQPPKLDRLSKAELEALREDAEFYQLPELLEALTPPKPTTCKFTPGEKYTLNTRQDTVTKTVDNYQWDTNALGEAIPATGITTVRFTIMQTGGAILLGLAPSSFNRDGTSMFNQSGWFVHTNSTLYSGPPTSFRGKTYDASTGRLSNGAVVDMVVDRNARTISFIVNGTNAGVAYQNVFQPTDELFPCAILYQHNDSVRMQLLSHTP
ncbi:hypothetical protein PTSG_06488 [Salpingoeca rosetta]|uniref:BTB domain-containing protein n=1 Tax=Salpingoeca rosetta (strain ATCC 50818 / BSB-021) TaxID=946362 RepID=F2UFY4_SALR5|nr:uncharacterized protein PTSG_06488 [Salpingoeca rosetta]EGD75412.1 hypothetical protein PTSG_06488 [Salpingoeca rosetta]|eukprot:XP_004991869.1 hypothetical protein PTSG_06488 [Salpingoeca rosetta]